MGLADKDLRQLSEVTLNIRYAHIGAHRQPVGVRASRNGKTQIADFLGMQEVEQSFQSSPDYGPLPFWDAVGKIEQDPLIADAIKPAYIGQVLYAAMMVLDERRS